MSSSRGKSDIIIRADELRAGDELNTHADVYWEVIEVREEEPRIDDGQGKDIVVEFAHDRRYTFAPGCLVRVLR